jgi:hypothetical protein
MYPSCPAIKKYVAHLPGSHWGQAIGSPDALLLHSYQKYVAELPGSHWGQAIGSPNASLIHSYQKICSRADQLSKNM